MSSCVSTKKTRPRSCLFSAKIVMLLMHKKTKLRSQATTELLWWTIQDSNLRMQPQAASIRGDPSGRCPDSNGHKFESTLLGKNKTPQSSDYGVVMVDDTRLELADAAAGGKHPRRSVRALPGLKWSQVRVHSFGKKQNSAVKRLRSCYGGRYKTRTCDLPHVKRMRYQLRQSSNSLSARGILYQSGGNVKIFFVGTPYFCGKKSGHCINISKCTDT